MNRWHLVCTLIIQLPFAAQLQAQEPSPILLWPAGAPGSEKQTAPVSVRATDQCDHVVSSVDHPSITPHLPIAEGNTGAGDNRVRKMY